MTADPDDRIRQLEAALQLYLDASADPDPTAARALLEQNPGLRELLEPMLAGAAPGPAAGVAAAGVGAAGAGAAGAGAAAAAMDHGVTLGDFRLLRELGRGGMGVVHEAVQVSLGRRVAIKLLPQSEVGPGAILRLRREAAIAAGLDHPGIVRVFASGLEGGTAWVAMECIDGVPLSRRLEEFRAGTAPHSLVAVARIAAEVAEALAHAHARGVTHRDVKPGNVLLRRDGSAVLSDFGLARLIDDPSLTRTGAIAGTPHYMAPEQASGERDRIGPHSDVFSLGTMLYEMATLVRPFDGDTTLAVLGRITSDEPLHPQRHDRGIPDDLAAIVLKALEKEPERRYRDGASFAADLRAFLAHRPVSARPATWWLRARR